MEVAVLLLLLQAVAEKETISIPDTKLSFDVVRISGAPGLEPFSIGAHEVTWQEFNAYHHDRRKGADAVTRPSHAEAHFGDMGVPAQFLEARRPVVLARWHAAIGYCEWLSLRTGRYFRLPTEKEWDVAARAGEKDAPVAETAWHQGNSERRTHNVGERKPNAFGLYDVLGNVWEYGLETGAPKTFSPILRGGSWAVPAAEMTFALRRTVPERWFEYDALRPRSVWWLAGPSAEQGFRVVGVPNAVEAKDREAVAGKFTVRILKHAAVDVENGKTRDAYCKVTGEVRNCSDRAVEELELQVFYLTMAGAPHVIDLESPVPGRPTFSKCWPVLKNGSDAAAALPLKPDESRSFEIFVPQTYDTPPDVNPNQFGGRVTNVKFTK